MPRSGGANPEQAARGRRPGGDDGTGACVFDDGDELVRNRIDVCTTSTYRYTEE